jgi:acetylornithine deacetylase/succinyl-diaminopimelate desuccinylase-like protein
MVLIEGSEESGSGDLAPTIDHLAPRLGEPSTLIALDAGCGDYDRLWVTTSLRGQVAGTLRVRSLREGVHSGDAAGIVPSPMRIARALLSRIEDEASGIVAPSFHEAIPPRRVKEAEAAGQVLGEAIHSSFPTIPGGLPVIHDPAQQLLNRAG